MLIFTLTIYQTFIGDAFQLLCMKYFISVNKDYRLKGGYLSKWLDTLFQEVVLVSPEQKINLQAFSPFELYSTS